MSSQQRAGGVERVVFAVDQKPVGDGAWLVRPRRVVAGREVGRAEAAAILRVSPDTVSALVRAGRIEGWQLPTRRGNGRMRISLESVLKYREAAVEEARRR